MVEWLAGNRIRGTSTERTTGTGFNPVPAGVNGVGGWKEVGRTTLGSAGDDINISSIPDKRYYMLLLNILNSGNSQPGVRLGNSSLDSGGNYGERWSVNGGTDQPQAPNTYHLQWVEGFNPYPLFGVDYISNKSGEETIGISHLTNPNTAGKGTAPVRQESVFKWTGTSLVDIIGFNNKGSGDFASDSEGVVLGWDPDDTHTDNFWEELASVDLSGGVADTLSASIVDKKYLWIQAYIEGSATAEAEFRVGDISLDTGTNYANRYSSDGGSDTLEINDTSITGNWTVGADVPIFWNIFIINNASNEKLAIVHGARQNTAGAGSAPRRFEIVGKWAETTNQIGIVGFDNVGTGNFNTNCIMKVWGHD